MSDARKELSDRPSEDKRERLAAALRRQLAAEERPPLSPGQRALWALHRLAPGSSAYNIAFTGRIVSPLDTSALRRAFQWLVDRHAALRCCFPAEDGEPVQRVRPQLEVPFEVADVPAEHVQDEIVREIKRPFDLTSGSLLRVRVFAHGAERFVATTFHHIVMDGWSLWICLSELGELYRAALAGVTPALPPPAMYGAHARWLAGMIDGDEGARHLDFWKRHLRDDVPVVDLPTDRPRPPVRTYRGASERIRLGPAATGALKQMARNARATPQMVLLAAFATLLRRYTGQDDLMIGYLASGRSRPEFEDAVGYLANLLPLRLAAGRDATFRELLRQTRDVLLEALDHQEYPFPLLVDRIAAERGASRSPLFQVLFVYEKTQRLDEENAAAFIAGIPGRRMNLGPLAIDSLPLAIQQEGQFDLALMGVEVDDELCLTVDYNTDLFDRTTICRLLGHLHALIDSAAANPDAPVSTLRMLTDEEAAQLRAWNEVRIDYGEGCAQDLIAARAAGRPDAVALVSGDSRLSYGDLDAHANRLARHLRDAGIGPDTPVGLLCDRSSFDLIVGLLAILKAGGAFVPLDAAHPPERLKFILSDSQAAVLVTQSALADRVPFGGRVIVVDRDREAVAARDAGALRSPAPPDRLAYIIYTSGSTGEPKGVMLQHRGLWNVVHEQLRVFRLGPGSRVLQFASLSFDSCVAEVMMALCSGAALHLASRESILPGLPLLEKLRSERITMVTLPPSALANLPFEPLPALDTLMVAGEACPPDLVARWAPGRRFINLYGPTEATIWATYAECVDGERLPPIGTPLANTRAYVVDRDRQEVPVGVPGELYVGGPGVARGYVNQPALTAQRFVPNPFASRPGERLYRTGDIVRRSEDGQLYYMGRADTQVKLRGFRIELEEIEAVLGRHPDVRQVIAMVREDTGDPRLVAYVLPFPSHTPSQAGLRTFAQAHLPDYMVPSAFVLMHSFPVNASGKVDRLALPAEGRPALNSPAAPLGRLEELIAGVWKAVLKTDSLGIDDNFFDLGGNSLLMARVHMRLAELSPPGPSIVDLFRFPTVRTLAGYLNRVPAPARPDGNRPDALAAGQARLRDQARRRSRAVAE